MTLDLLLPAAFLAGFFGSGHCLGMCGPVVVLLESPDAEMPSFAGTLRRMSYNTGRLLFYVLAGAAAGGVGLFLTDIAGVGTGLSLLRFLAAALVIAIGLNLLFDLRILGYLEKSGALLWRRLSRLARHVLPASTPVRALGAGFVWGALPCGLVYSSVALAATSGSSAAGALVMLVFWFGTLPALLVAGASASKLGDWASRPLLRRLAGTAMAAIGVFALLMPYLHTGNDVGAGHRHSHSFETLPEVVKIVGRCAPCDSRRTTNM